MKAVGKLPRTGLLVCASLALSARATGQEPYPPGTQPPAASTPAPTPSWSFDVSGALYVLPGEDDFLQPVVRADRGRLHLETRYDYEDHQSVSFFAGARFGFGSKVEVSLVPILGGVVGRTDGIVPGLEADITAGRFEAYGEAEYVVDLGDSSSSYFYMWSELSWWGTDWLRAGLATQRTRVYRTERDIQRGPLVGAKWGRVSGSLYWFNPGADDWAFVAAVGVSF
jgi:hypothetical protein